jgi:S-adenosylmethionine hydrolase
VTGRVSFLSDYGLEDEFVGVVHAVIDRTAPGTRVVDVTHGVPRHDVNAGAMTLWRAVPWLVPGVVLAVVDPGVGTPRRAVALSVRSAGAFLVGPDNGLLLPGALRLGAITAAVVLPPADPAPAGATFAGRDLFAPVAARLAAGIPLSDLGEPIDPAALVGRPFEGAICESTVPPLLVCRVTWVDRFGNAQLNAAAEDLTCLGTPPAVTLRLTSAPIPSAPARPVPARVVSAYGELSTGELGVVVDSYGMLSLCAREASAAERFGLRAGDPVRVGPPG